MTTTETSRDDLVFAATPWPTNADLIVEVAHLGYLHEDWRTLDPTYGKGTWWKKWRPVDLVACDINPKKSPIGYSVDFTQMRWDDGEYQAVVLDAPYKLNGTPTHEADEPYGVAGAYTSAADRHRLMLDGVSECARVLAPGGYLLVKCQDQVNGGKVRWQTDMVTERAESLGLVKVDSFLMLGGRPQDDDRKRPGCPTCGGKVTKVKAGRKCREHGIVDPVDVLVEQEHARRNYSTLLVFRKPPR